MGRCGFSVDNLLSAEIVLSRLVHRHRQRIEPSGSVLGNSGRRRQLRRRDVVRIPPARRSVSVLAGLVRPSSRTAAGDAAVLPRFRARPHLTSSRCIQAIMTFPLATSVAAFHHWSGLAICVRREACSPPFGPFGPPIVDMVQPMPYTAAQSDARRGGAYGRHNYWKSGFLRELHDDAADTLLMHGRRITSPYSLCLIEHIHGAPTRVSPDATAFYIRNECFHFVAIASWDPADEAARHVNWARDLWTDMQRWAAGRAREHSRPR